MEALRTAWAADMVRQAIAAVSSASDDDYRAFGWERGELLARLWWLRGEIEEAGGRRGISLAVTLRRTGRSRRPEPATKTLGHHQP
jgi:hypothetical protein